MRIEFDAEKNASNLTKHGIALDRAADLLDGVAVLDPRFVGEQRYRIYGLLDGQPHCLAAVLRNGALRAISLRRAHIKEYRRHVGT